MLAVDPATEDHSDPGEKGVAQDKGAANQEPEKKEQGNGKAVVVNSPIDRKKLASMEAELAKVQNNEAGKKDDTMSQVESAKKAAEAERKEELIKTLEKAKSGS